MSANVFRQEFGGGFAAKRREAEKWAEIWFAKLCKFHNRPKDSGWQFTAAHVIEYLQSKVRNGYPAWKRLKIVEGLMVFQAKSSTAEPADLQFIATKLKTFAVQEKAASSGQIGGIEVEQGCETAALTEEEIVGKINPREPDSIQQMRRKLRLVGHATNTERAYVKWVRRFLKSRGKVFLADCRAIAREDVEAFLTDLVVDGNVGSGLLCDSVFLYPCIEA